ncbi:pyrrolysine--tRNA(Pyl) ligase small subunit [Eubacterium limosum]|uniref:pyrrolysine--tRNA(Pyl) ligase small subunit n=1 Tax=Eubacterium limosum TaxID=1736 RepID=UPI0010645B6E|nr:pyrrolysine--tRNA(Pyl) ligase small subunit [Eubacterium limosum]
MAEVKNTEEKKNSNDREKLKKRYIQKNQNIYRIVSKIKLWPARSGVLHSVKTIERKGGLTTITTYCGETFTVWDSKNSRSARWLRNRWYREPCPKCGIPDWKLSKYSTTVFSHMKNGKI